MLCLQAPAWVNSLANVGEHLVAQLGMAGTFTVIHDNSCMLFQTCWTEANSIPLQLDREHQRTLDKSFVL